MNSPKNGWKNFKKYEYMSKHKENKDFKSMKLKLK